MPLIGKYFIYCGSRYNFFTYPSESFQYQSLIEKQSVSLIDWVLSIREFIKNKGFWLLAQRSVDSLLVATVVKQFIKLMRKICTRSTQERVWGGLGNYSFSHNPIQTPESNLISTIFDNMTDNTSSDIGTDVLSDYEK